MNVFHVCGSLLAIWALVVSFLGITREGFPGSVNAARAVGAVSILLTVATIGSAIYTGVAEEEEHPEGGDEAALVRPI